MSDVFIGYAREDRAYAQRLARALEAEGWSVWWDVRIPAGKTFDDVIEEAIKAARCVIVLWSKVSVTKRWVRTEAEHGASRKILVPILIEDEVEVPFAFKLIHAAHLVGWDGSDTDAFQGLLSDIATVVGPPLSRKEGEHLLGPDQDSDPTNTAPDIRVVAVRRNATVLFLVDAVVVEDDTYLVLGADPVAHEQSEPPAGLLEAARAGRKAALGGLVPRGGEPPRFSAVVHDLDEEPTWREESVAAALREIIEEAARRGWRSLAVPVLGGVHGTLRPARFADLLLDAFKGSSSPQLLEELWVTSAPGMVEATVAAFRAAGLHVWGPEKL